MRDNLNRAIRQILAWYKPYRGNLPRRHMSVETLLHNYGLETTVQLLDEEYIQIRNNKVYPTKGAMAAYPPEISSLEGDPTLITLEALKRVVERLDRRSDR